MITSRFISLDWNSTRRSLLLALGTLPFACDLPRDPRRSLERARNGGELRVGASEYPPWVVRDAEGPRGVEPDIVSTFAREIGARITWTWGATDALLDQLTRYELDLVIGGLVARSPWQKKLGFTRPYLEVGGEKRVIAVAPGENALLTALDRSVIARRGAS